MTIYLASADVRHLAVHSTNTIVDALPEEVRDVWPGRHTPDPAWAALCDRAAADSQVVSVHPNAADSSPTVRISKPICRRCLHVLADLTAASRHTPAPPPRPLPNTA